MYIQVATIVFFSNQINTDQRTNVKFYGDIIIKIIYMYTYLSSRWTEMDPLYLLETVVNGIEIVAQQLKDKDISIKQVKCTPIFYSFFFLPFCKVLSYFSEFYLIFIFTFMLSVK